MQLAIKIIHANGGLARTKELLCAGIEWEWLRIAHRYGGIVKVSKGWWAANDTAAAAIEARRAGGRLACVSALSFLYPSIDYRRASTALHVEVPHSSSRLNHADPAIRFHWARTPSPGSNATVCEQSALRQMRKCLGAEQARELVQHIERTIALDRV